MYEKKIITLTTLVLFAAVLVCIGFIASGMSLKAAIVEIISYIFYGLLVFTYALRLAFIFFGLYGLYRMIRDWYSRRIQVGIVL